MEIEEEPLVKTAASLFQRLCYNYRDQVSAGIICAGWDRKVGPQVMLPFLLSNNNNRCQHISKVP